MLNRKTKFINFVVFFILLNINAKAQNYFHTTIKMPLTEYISALLNGGSDNQMSSEEETDGLSFNSGYAIKVAPHFYTETGIDYLILNREIKKSYTNENYLELRNSVFAFQVRPTYRPILDADEIVNFNLGLALNYQKVITEGIFIDYLQRVNAYARDKTQSKWFFNIQPHLGFDFVEKSKFGYRFNITYAKYDWTNTEQNLRFSNNPSLNLPSRRTSNIFFSAGFVF